MTNDQEFLLKWENSRKKGLFSYLFHSEIIRLIFFIIFTIILIIVITPTNPENVYLVEIYMVIVVFFNISAQLLVWFMSEKRYMKIKNLHRKA